MLSHVIEIGCRNNKQTIKEDEQGDTGRLGQILVQILSKIASDQVFFVSNRVAGLSPRSLLNCFLSGLKPDIQRQLQILRPTSITQATEPLPYLTDHSLFTMSFTRSGDTITLSGDRPVSPTPITVLGLWSLTGFRIGF
ncbi:hypothetical protein POM88_053847 [Heracleum sosnowskyi]|uniref:Uncharacterized protein n=1 Tax=Heracleum sosnowskyi TaxID=360622 RepID=A0AAD8GNW7_9APIA|nr:hypothetical protein POM88_053847 [Heracleum sosnowskyi]